ncbi:unnamed protein product [Lupinus luteus]|uniref:Uncharacterized protein n=1 Tax=Lupinus luteus TaxID=3873 RepID=A0AAV1XWA6_LUPLU
MISARTIVQKLQEETQDAKNERLAEPSTRPGQQAPGQVRVGTVKAAEGGRQADLLDRHSELLIRQNLETKPSHDVIHDLTSSSSPCFSEVAHHSFGVSYLRRWITYLLKGTKTLAEGFGQAVSDLLQNTIKPILEEIPQNRDGIQR